MTRFTRMSVGAINITASPHEPGTYEKILQAAAEKPIWLGGSDYAKITRTDRRKDGRLIGRIIVWTEIDKKGAWLNSETNDTASNDDKQYINIPEKLKPNYRYFYFGFDPKSHLMIFEFKNESGQSFGPARANKFFGTLLSQETLGTDFPLIDVTLIPEEGAVEKILTIPKLRRLKIVLTRPNPGEDLHDEITEIMRKLEAQKAGKWINELVKAPKVDHLEPSDETKLLARVAATNGYVEGEGKHDGKAIHDSTKEHPKSVPIEVGEDAESTTQFMSAFNNFQGLDKSSTGN